MIKAIVMDHLIILEVMEKDLIGKKIFIKI